MTVSIRARIVAAIHNSLMRRDVNNGKLYCISCGANEPLKRKGEKWKHDAECAVEIARTTP